jgi:protein required for attachment to host cells
MKNNLTWLLVADASKARIFSTHKAKLFQDTDNPKLLQLVGEFTHDKSRMKSTDLVTDKLGGFGGNSYGAEQPQLHEAETFASHLLHELNTARLDHHFKDLILVAPPTFMGLLHKQMPNEIHKMVSTTIEKDYTKENIADLIKKLVTHL